jgi:hypothetical protein
LGGFGNFGQDFGQINASGVSLRWNPEEIGFFEPDNADGAEDYEYSGKATIWKNVYLFVDAFKFNSAQGREVIVRTNL